MKKWTDREGRDWTIDVNVGTVRKVKADTEIDLLKISDASLSEQLSDPMTLCDVLWSLVEHQAAEKDVTPESFGSSLAGDCLESALDSLMQEIIDFFPSRRRQILQKLMDKARAAENQMIETAMEKADSKEMEAEIKKIMDVKLKG
jgi:hypothetical protein